jgi:hypothetical protein
MTNGELSDLIATLQRSTPLSRLKPDAAHMVFLTLIEKGYTIVSQGTKGRFPESDDEWHTLRRWLSDTSPLGALSSVEAKAVFDALSGMGLKVREPDQHPSGLRTTEKAFVDVKRIGAGSAYKVIDRTGMPDDGVASTFNGGQSK